MILTVIIVGFLNLAMMLWVFFYINRLINREKQAFLQSLRSYFESVDGNTPSQFALLTDAIAERFGQKVASHLKASFMGTQSAESKNVKRVEGAIAQDLIMQKSPLMGSIMSQFPALGKLITKNPNLIGLIQNFMPGQNGGANEEVNDNDFAKRLNEY